MDLNDRQTAMLHNAAALLPDEQREGFCNAVHGALDALLNFAPNDRQLQDCLRHLLAARGISIDAGRVRKTFRHERSGVHWQSWAAPHRKAAAPERRA